MSDTQPQDILRLVLAAVTADFDAQYVQLRRRVEAAGLLERAYVYYIGRTASAYALLLAGGAMAVLVPRLWWLSGVALAFGSVQVAFIGHDAGHRAVFNRAWANHVLGELCWTFSLGIGFGYWFDRHNRHHRHTNDLDADPDLQWANLVAYSEETLARRPRTLRALTRYQFILAPLLTLGLAFAFRVEGWVFAVRRLRGWDRAFEVGLLALSTIVWLLPTFVLGPPWLAAYALSQALGGLYLGAAVAPNHKGMPTWSKATRLSFLERQVLSSRNVRPGRFTDFVLGGLNYQIEHHLFPSMPRLHFSRARAIVRPFLTDRGLPYDEMDALSSYGLVLAELRRVGRAVA